MKLSLKNNELKYLSRRKLREQISSERPGDTLSSSRLRGSNQRLLNYFSKAKEIVIDDHDAVLKITSKK